jgi:branched-chain amino acid transport system substrate-binding protein
MKAAFWLAGALVLSLSSPTWAGDTIKIGFVDTFSGPSAAIGNDARNGFELALDHIGHKMDGKIVEVIYEDDQQKPEVGKQKTEKLIQSDRVDFLAGYNWSNVLLASLKPAIGYRANSISDTSRDIHSIRPSLYLMRHSLLIRCGSSDLDIHSSNQSTVRARD